MQEGDDKQAYLAIYDEVTGRFLPVPDWIGRFPGGSGKDMKESFCWLAVHTHDGDGTLHLAVDPRNTLSFKPVLEAIAKRYRRPIPSFAIWTNGRRGVVPMFVQPEMHINIVMRRGFPAR